MASEVSVTEMTQQEWDLAVARSLEQHQLTFEQLTEMAERRNFTSLAAKKLWFAIRPR